MEHRVLVYAPRGRDAEVIRVLLQREQFACVVCDSGSVFLEALKDGAATAVVTEEVLGGGFDEALGTFLSQQPAWSDFPFVVLAMRQAGRRSARALASLQELGNLILLERPVNPETLARAVHSAQRARRRQYATRQNLQDLEASKATVERFNAELETRIAARTADLAGANDRLMRESVERERMQAGAVQSQKLEAIGRLTGGIAHDFNNLLHAISMNVQFITRVSEDERISNYARKAKASVERGTRLTGQLLSFARSGSLLPKPHEINVLVGNLQELIEVSVGSKIHVSTQLCEEPLWIKVDGAQMEMALLNLAVNARDAMREGGELVIRSEPSVGADGQPQACVSVADNGSGIPAAVLSRVFDPFFTTKSNGEGTGLGLSQVYGFTQQSGGSAQIQSRQGEGTTVTLRFPTTQAPVDRGEAESGPPGDRAQPLDRRLEVLVVEDDEEVRSGIVESLRLLHYNVREASNGANGLEELRRITPDLLMVDYLMPGMTGAELATRSKALCPELPVLMATGYADMAEVEKVVGADSVLRKPFDMESLHRAVEAALSSRIR